MRRNKRKTTKMSLLMMLLLLGIGFAALTATLKINGTVDVSKASWDVHFENVSITEGSVTATTVPTSDDETTTEMTYVVNFTKPGDFYEFTVDMVNDGSIDAMVDLVTNKVYSSDGETERTLPNYLRSSVTYSDGNEILPNQLLAKQASEKIKVRVEFRTDIDSSDLPSSADTIIFKFSGTFKQADKTSCQRPTTFENDSWDTIQCNVKNNPSSYPVGATKNIEMDIDDDNTNETYTLRVANNTTPSECNTQGFSQTACGFVVEFQDIITEHRMNPYVYEDSTTIGVNGKGGWENSDMRAYLNSTVYAHENIDYSDGGIYNALPSDLKNKIIDTTVVSGYGPGDTANFVTTDKIYLLAVKEVYGSNPRDYDTSASLSRQLDYYYNNNVTSSDYSEATKQYSGSNSDWYYRSVTSYEIAYFSRADSNGGWGVKDSSGSGVSPAFRIG